MRPCGFSGCERPHKALGYCITHYRKFKRDGFVHYQTIQERFWSKVNKATDCWVWTRCLNEHGYGEFRTTVKSKKLAHVWAYEEQFGAVPEGLELDHLCRVGSCVRPQHLEAVTHLENVQRGLYGAGKSRLHRGPVAA